MDWLDEIKARAEAATPGPWLWEDDELRSGDVYVISQNAEYCDYPELFMTGRAVD